MWVATLGKETDRKWEEGDDIRGSGDIFAILDAAITFRRRANTKTQRVLTTFSRYSTQDDLIISLENGHYAELGNSYHVDLVEQKSKILAVLASELKGSDEIATQAGIPAGTTRKVLSALEEAGEIFKTGEGKRNSPYLFSLLKNNHVDISAQNQTLRDAELFPGNSNGSQESVQP